MKEKITRICMVCGLLIVLVAQFALAATSTDSLSNEMLAWGFRRGEEHQQPDLDSRKFESFKTI